MNVLFLTHSYPREDGDAAGSFILRLARALATEGVNVRVVAPGARGLAAHETLGGIPVDRFRYAPRRFETLAYGGNMAAQVRDSWARAVALVGFLGAEFQAGVTARREFNPALVHAHWWFPNGLARQLGRAHGRTAARDDNAWHRRADGSHHLGVASGVSSRDAAFSGSDGGVEMARRRGTGTREHQAADCRTDAGCDGAVYTGCLRSRAVVACCSLVASWRRRASNS